MISSKDGINFLTVFILKLVYIIKGVSLLDNV